MPFSVEEDRKAWEGDGLHVSFHSGEEELQGLLVSIQTHTCLLQTVFIHHLPDVPHLVDSVLDHAEGGHEGVLIWEAPWKVQPGGQQILIYVEYVSVSNISQMNCKQQSRYW